MKRLLAVVSAIVLGVAGCGGGGEPAATTIPTTGTTSPAAQPTTAAPTPVGTGTGTPTSSAQGECTPASGEGMTDGVQTGTAVVRGLRAASHDDYDRVVLEFDVAPGDVSVQQVTEVVDDPAGTPVAVDGDAFTVVVVQNAAVDWAQAQATDPADPVRRYTGARELRCTLPLVKEVEIVGDFEATLSVAVGLGEWVTPTVTRLSGPDRVVVDFPYP